MLKVNLSLISIYGSFNVGQAFPGQNHKYIIPLSPAREKINYILSNECIL